MLLWAIISGHRERTWFDRNAAATVCTVVAKGPSGSMATQYIDCAFKVDGQGYVACQTLHSPSAFWAIKVGDQLRVEYDPSDPNRNRFLLPDPPRED